MASKGTIVVVGAGLAGAKAAETLRTEGYDGRVVLIGEEALRPYERPPLSKEYLRGEKGFDDAAVHPADFYEVNGIELRTSSPARRLDPAASEVTLESGERVGYDRLLLATGAEPRRPPLPGAGLEGVHYLRRLDDADGLRAAIGAGGAMVVVGGGWIGAEVAASARQLGAEVALVEQGALPLERALGPEVAAVYRDLHAEHGVDLHLGVGVAELAGSDAVTEVRLEDGTVLPAGIVVVGVGARPRTELAEGAGLAVANGIAVDEHLETSAPGVFAAGDVADAFHPRYGARVRLEHWSAALNQGPAAARNMLGQGVSYDRVPYFYSDQYDLGMEYRGWAPTYDEVVFRGDTAARSFLAFWLQAGTVVAAMNANVWDEGEALATLVRSGRRVDTSLLRNPDVAIAELADGR